MHRFVRHIYAVFFRNAAQFLDSFPEFFKIERILTSFEPCAAVIGVRLCVKQTSVCKHLTIKHFRVVAGTLRRVVEIRLVIQVTCVDGIHLYPVLFGVFLEKPAEFRRIFRKSVHKHLANICACFFYVFKSVFRRQLRKVRRRADSYFHKAYYIINIKLLQLKTCRYARNFLKCRSFANSSANIL